MSIPRFKKENYGSLYQIEYVPSFGIENFFPSTGGTIAAEDLTLKTGFVWQNLNFTIDTSGHQQDQNNSVHGELWAQQVQAFITGDEEAIEVGLLDLSEKRFVLKVTLYNGTKKIIGTPKEPLDFKLKSNTQDTVPGRPGTAITFFGETLKRALFLLA